MSPSAEDSDHGGETDLNVTEGFCATIGGVGCCGVKNDCNTIITSVVENVHTDLFHKLS
jgi:hypothetical protein